MGSAGVDLEDVRLAVRTGFARHGRPPTVAEQPAQAADYLRSVGLSGEFWGL